MTAQDTRTGGRYVAQERGAFDIPAPAPAPSSDSVWNYLLAQHPEQLASLERWMEEHQVKRAA